MLSALINTQERIVFINTRLSTACCTGQTLPVCNTDLNLMVSPEINYDG
jgi:hypothetical protein